MTVDYSWGYTMPCKKLGMALWQAKQVCPDITFVSPRMDLYLRFSRMAHEIYAEYTDRQEPYGIDECWFDVTGSSSLNAYHQPVQWQWHESCG